MERLDKQIAHAALISRKQARDNIRAGLVTVNGLMCAKPEQQVSQHDVLTLGGQDLR